MDIFKDIKISIILTGLIVLFVCMFSNIGFADPSIMLYVDGGADYYWNDENPAGDPTITSHSTALIYTEPNTWFTDSFVTFDSNFTLLIEMFQRGEEGWSPYFCDMHLVVAVPEGESGSVSVYVDGSLLGMTGYGLPYNKYGSTFKMPPHGVYPTPYSLYSINNGECLTADTENDPIFLVIDWEGYSKVHFDVFAYNEKGDGGAWVVNPFSHDVTATRPIPEPGTLILFGTGIIGMIGSFARKRFVEFKRFLDIIFSGIGVVLLSPLFLFIGILIKLDSKGPIFYQQIRVGKNWRKNRNGKMEKGQKERRKIDALGCLFMVHKFRTMEIDAEAKTGPVWAKEDDTRVTRIGHFLRKTHLDELPQLFNVFIGEMSLVGPRPERPVFVDNFKRVIPEYNKRLKVKPGITGLAQVRHGYDETIDDVKKKTRYDLLYVNNRSWLGEARVMMWTVRRVLTGRGAR